MESRERQFWIAAGVWLFAIYSTLYVARGITDFLRERNLLRLSVAVVFAMAAAVLFSRFVRARPGLREAGVLAVFLVLAFLLVRSLGIVEERIHVLEYGALTYLFFRALLERGSPRPALQAAFLAAAAGWVDEAIQYFLPNRHYDWRDVRLNVAACVLTAACLATARVARARDQLAR